MRLRRASKAIPSVVSQRRRKHLTFLAGYGFLILVALLAERAAGLFGPLHAASTIFLIGLIVMAVAKPAAALGVVVTLTLVGDQRAMPWWPFDKNLSSAESLLYTVDGLTVKPLEIMLLGILLLVLINQLVGERRHRKRQAADAPGQPQGRDPILIAVGVLGASVVGGVIWGLSRGGDVSIALLEAVFMMYVPLVFLTARKLFTTMGHYRNLLVGMLLAISIESLHGWLMLSRLRETIPEGFSPLSHTAALQMNLLFLALVATLVLRRRATLSASLLLVAVVPTLLIYIESERRSAIVASLVAIILLGVVVFHLERRRFNILAPILLVCFVAYMGIFWNSEGGLAFPAQTVRNIVVPDTRSYLDAGSDRYRDFENFNLQMTIRSSPLLGFGYGQEFLQPIPLPRLAGNFTFAAFSPHNAVLGLWVKAGFAGLLSYVFLVGAGTASGLRSILGAIDPRDRVVLFVLVANLPMTLVVSFVEIAFESQTTTVLGISLALVSTAPRMLGLSTGRDPDPDDEREHEADDDTRAEGPDRTLPPVRLPVGV